MRARIGPGNVPSWSCIPQGMPMMMNIYDPMEIVVTDDIAYILISHVNDSYRRIYTDGRDWPAEGKYELTYGLGRLCRARFKGCREFRHQRSSGPHSRNGRYGIFDHDRAGHSALMPANFTTLLHFSVSSAMNFPKSAGEPAKHRSSQVS
jgi:hypothetical protein